jgi:nitrate reductase gamma subunit
LDQLLAETVFVVFPYFIIAVFLIGSVHKISRWISSRSLTGLATVSVVPRSYGFVDIARDVATRAFTFYPISYLDEDRPLVIGSLMFHYGIWVVLVGHVAMLVNLGMSASLHATLAFYLGTVAGFVALGGLLVLLARRVGIPRIRSISFLDDFFAIALLLAVIALGLANTTWLKPDYMNTVAPWLVSILTFRPEVATMSGVSLVTEAHVLVSLVFIGYAPLGKMNHVLSLLFSPTIAGKSYELAPQGSVVEGSVTRGKGQEGSQRIMKGRGRER